MILAAVGNAIATATLSVGARFFAMFLMPMGAVSACMLPSSGHPQSSTNSLKDQIIVSWVANSFPRPLVKRSAAIAISNMIGNCANIYGSYLYPGTDAPRYIPGGSANTAICVVVALLALLLRYVHIRENRKLERNEGEEHAHEPDEDGYVDRRAFGFRYIY